MKADQSKRLLDLVDDALQLAPSQRRAWVKEACGEDEALKEQALELIGYDSRAELLLKTEPGQAEAEASLCHTAGSPEGLQPGHVLGDYTIQGCLGAGGMGVVYRARQRSLQRQVALKTLPSHLRHSPSGVARFRKEVEAAARLRHPNLVAVYSAGEDDGIAYYSMELIEGPSVNDLLMELRNNPVSELRDCQAASSPASETPAPLSPWARSLLESGKQASVNSPDPKGSGGDKGRPRGYFDIIAEMLAGVADGIDCAHRLQVVHRDIKPSNLLLSPDGRLHLSDFGLARILNEPGMTQTGEFVGTPYYMAPEQLDPSLGKVGGHSDTYALGATLYELLTLSPPLPGDSREEVLSRITTTEPCPPRRRNPRIPRDLETICLKALEKAPERRYASAEEMAADLRRFTSRLPIVAKRAGIVDRSMKWCRRHPSTVALLVAAVGLAGLAVGLAYRAHDAQHQAAIESLQRQAVTAKAEQAEADLAIAQQTVQEAQRNAQRRVFEASILASMQSDHQAAEAAIAEAERMGTAPGRLHIMRGQVALQRGRFKTAASELENAVALIPNSVAARASLAETYMKRARWTEANAILEEISESDALSAEDLLLWGRAESIENPIKAIGILDRAVEMNRQSVVSRLVRGAVRTKLASNNAAPTDARLAIDDLQSVEPFLEPSPYFLGQKVHAHLVAANALEHVGDASAEKEALDRAGALAEELSRFPGEFLAHRWRAFYFDRIDADELAITEWRKIRRKTISFLVLTLYRDGQYKEALRVCEEARQSSTSGVIDLWRPFVIAGTCDTIDELEAACEFGKFADHDSRFACLSYFMLACLMGSPERGSELIRAHQEATDQARHGNVLHDFYLGDASGDELIAADDARTELCGAHLRVGMKRLAEGKRAEASSHFQLAADCRATSDYAYFLSRALLAQLSRQPDWPTWIPSESSSK